MKLLTSAVQLPSGANIVNDLSNILEVFSQCEETFYRESKPFRRHRRLVRSCCTSMTWFKPSGRGAAFLKFLRQWLFLSAGAIAAGDGHGILNARGMNTVMG